jgi:hypothetical protein
VFRSGADRKPQSRPTLLVSGALTVWPTPAILARFLREERSLTDIADLPHCFAYEFNSRKLVSKRPTPGR